VYSPSTRFTIHLVDQLLHTTPKGNMRPLRNGSLGAGWVHGKRGPAEWPGPRGGNEAVLIPMYANNVAATTSISTVSQPPAFPGSCFAPPRAGVSGLSTVVVGAFSNTRAQRCQAWHRQVPSSVQPRSLTPASSAWLLRRRLVVWAVVIGGEHRGDPAVDRVAVAGGADLDIAVGLSCQEAAR
jgi:hypothetical protein